MFKTLWKWRPLLIAILICVAVSAILADLIVTAAAGKEIQGWPRLRLVAIGVIAVISGLVATGDAPWQEADLRAWLRPKPLAMTLVAVFGAFGVLTGVIALTAPRAAVELRPLEIRDDVKTIKYVVVKNHMAQEPAIRQQISGVWGLIGSSCSHSFAIRLHDDTLEITGVGQPANTERYHAIGTVTSARGNVLESFGAGSVGRGIASTFTFTGNSLVKRLEWKDQTGDVPPTELEWCRSL